MRSDLRASDLSALLRFAEATLAVNDFATIGPAVLGGLTAVVGCEAATLTSLDTATQREVAVLWPSARSLSEALHDYAPAGHLHPLRRPLAESLRHGRHGPLRISDVLTAREWRRSALYATSHRGLSDQMTLVLATRGSAITAVTLSRSGRPFTDRQHAVLARCQAHVGAALARCSRDGHLALQIAPVVRVVPATSAPGLSETTARPVAGHLSAREREVLALVATGLTDAGVARRLGLSPATVSKHLTRIYTRLGLPNRAAAVKYWLEQPPGTAR